MVSDGAAVQIGILVATVAGLWIGARLLVDSVIRLARRLGLSELTIGLTVVAAGTSTPELVVTADAALAGLGAIAVGNVVGSNIYNLAFILGVVSLVRIIPIERSLVHRDGVVLVVSTLVGAAVMFDRTVVRVEGAVLLVSFVAYTAYLLRTGDGTPDTVPSSVSEGIPTALTERVTFRGRDAVLLVLGLAVVLVSGDLMVGAASTLARAAGIPDSIIGGTIVAAGTSTPEFAVSLVAIRQGRLGVSVGNVVGSNIFNMLGVLGVAAVIRPVSFGSVALESVAWLIVVTVVVVAALWTGRKLSRPEGAVFAASEVGRWVLGLLGLVG
ncbi:calcium/sodium antiporter [Halogeometricum sp. CBA1124]|uniref:calcium/sodium antiporter n=1 Tax=Halogeometricum sp. CBA1124 TaxID=2668071 RepID=UPI00142AD222|nr:calcium/sodium antiporter [Halogeometricum sp. CBA1124]MUV56864.1 calcium/sodium antiporter [Halogeometricum sp. CBA1124]